MESDKLFKVGCRCNRSDVRKDILSDGLPQEKACPLTLFAKKLGSTLFSRLHLYTLTAALCVIAVGVIGLLLSLLLGWDNSNIVLFTFVIITISGAMLYIYNMKHESRY